MKQYKDLISKRYRIAALATRRLNVHSNTEFQSVGVETWRRPVRFFLNENPHPAAIRRNVLLIRTKNLLVGGEAVKLFSFDGRTWFSKPSDYQAYRKRIVRDKVTCQEAFSSIASGLSSEMPDHQP